jgi:sugar lactone lactonase YvrE
VGPSAETDLISAMPHTAFDHGRETTALGRRIGRCFRVVRSLVAPTPPHDRFIAIQLFAGQKSLALAPADTGLRGARPFSRAALLLLCLFFACAVSVASAAVASAATPGQSYGYKGDIGTPSGPPPFGTAGEIAADGDGNTLLSNQAAGRVDIIDPSGTSIAQITTSASGFFAPSSVAVSPDGSTVYVVETLSTIFGPPTILKYTRSGASPPVYTQDTSWVAEVTLDPPSTFGLAVDPSTGDLLVGAGWVYRFDGTTGALLATYNGASTALGVFTAKGIAVAPNRDIYVIAGPGRVEHLRFDGAPKGALPVPFAEGLVSPSGIAVNPQTGDVAVELMQSRETVIQIFTAANDLKDTIRVPPSLALDDGGGYDNTGVAFSADGTKIYVATNSGVAHVFALGTRPGTDPPTASQITTTGAHLAAVVADAGEPSTARIEYCLASDPCDKYLVSVSSDPADLDYDPRLDPSNPAYNPTETPDPWIRLSTHTDLSSPISDDLAGLSPNTRYLVRTYAINTTTGVECISATASFRTAVVPPNVTTGAASAITDTTADLAGTIDAIGDQTTYHFEYGLTTNYGSRAPAGAEAIAGSGRTPRTFSQTVKGLQRGTTYHYRLVATNSAGSTAGADGTFTTLGVDQVAPRRGYEQVTSPNKQGMSLFSNWGFQALGANGSAIVYSAAEASQDASSSPQASRFLAKRETNDWNGQKPLDPPMGTTRGIASVVTQAVSEDANHTLVISQRALTPGAIEGGANIYIGDVDTGAYHLVGATNENNAYTRMVGPSTMDTFIAGAEDFSWIVLTSQFPLTAGAPQVAMYRWTRTGGLSLISKVDTDTIPAGEVDTQTLVRQTNRLVSNDGNTVAFSVHGGNDGNDGVYRRVGNQSTAISVMETTNNPPTATQPGTADGVSRDGRFVVFHSSVQLTDSATDSGQKLYRYDADAPAGDKLDYLGLLSAAGSYAADVLGISDDGSTVYYNNSTGPGTGEAVVWRNGQLDVVSPVELQADRYGYPSPNGQYFEYVATDASVHLYDAAAGDETCVSCPADGGSAGQGRIGGLPDRNLSNRFSQVVTDSGHGFFDTTVPLISADRNGTSDVYEYFKGRLTLISPGDRDFIATLADISPDGSSVFFTTAEGLVGQDTDQGYDLYAARIGGGFAAHNPAPPNAPCAKSECAEPGPGPVASPPVGSLPQPQGKPGKRTNQAKVKVSLTRVSIGKTMRITVHASQRGRLKVSGVRVVTTYRNLAKEGTYSISVPLSKKARSLQRAKKRFKVAVKVSLAGGWGTSSAKYSRTLNK